jgi:cytidylate kinase
VTQLRPLITVDGSAGTGKSTLGRFLASSLALPFIDTGLFYRAVAVEAHRRGITVENAEQAGAIASSVHIQVNLDSSENPTWLATVDDRDVTSELFDPKLSLLIGAVSNTPSVRKALLEPQRQAGKGGGVAVGRDCGTVIFPDAKPKFFLEAAEHVRINRRAADLQKAGHQGESAATTDIAGRDRTDLVRTLKADGVYTIDTGAVGVEEMCSYALDICAQYGIEPGLS